MANSFIPGYDFIGRARNQYEQARRRQLASQNLGLPPTVQMPPMPWENAPPGRQDLPWMPPAATPLGPPPSVDIPPPEPIELEPPKARELPLPLTRRLRDPETVTATNLSQEARTLLEAVPIAGQLSPKQQQGVFQGLKDYVNKEENMGRLIMALNSMRRKPDPNIAAMALDRIKSARTTKSANKTVEALRARGMSEEDIEAIRGNPELLKSVATKVLTRNLGVTEYGLTPKFATNREGDLVALQFGSRGEAVQTKLPEGVQLVGDVQKIDLGTEWGLYDVKSQELVDRVPKDLKEAEIEKAAGKALGEQVATLDKDIVTAQRTVNTIETALNHPGLAAFVGPVDASTPTLLPDARAFKSYHDQLHGQAFLTAFEQLKGGGQITEIEGVKATQAIARLDAAMSEEDYMDALRELQQIARDALSRARSKQKIYSRESDPLGIR